MKITQLLLLLSIQLFGLYVVKAQSEVAPELLDRMQEEPEAYLPVYLLLHNRLDVAELHTKWTAAGQSQSERVKALIPALQAKAKSTQAPLLNYLSTHPQVRPGSVSGTWVVNLIFLEARASLIAELAQRTDIDFIGEDHLLEIAAFERSEEAPLPSFDQTRERSLEVIRATDMWRLGYTGYGRKALVIDTGNEFDHPALKGQYLGQREVTRESWSGTGDPVPCTEDGGSLSDHGTHVTGTVCGLDRLTEDTIGVAFDAQWMGGGVFLSDCNAFSSGGVRSTFETFQWALNPDGNPNTTSDMPDVINNSWGSPPASNCSFSPYIDLAYTMNAAGIAVVFSAGNRGDEGPESIGMPAGLALDLVTMFSVANIDARSSNNWRINGSSSIGPTRCSVNDSSLLIKPEVGAPGTRIRSAVTGGGYDSFNGTSMAAPHVSGAVLLLKEAFPELLGIDLLEALYYTCTDLGTPGEDNLFGQGMINVRAAYDYLINAGHTPTPPITRNNEVIALDLGTNLINCGEEFQFQFYIENGSPDTVRQLDIFYNLNNPGGVNGDFPWEGELLPGERMWINSPPIAAADGEYRLTARATLPNGVPDARFENNQLRTDLIIIAEEAVELLVNTASNCEGARTVLQAGNILPTDEVIWYTTSPDSILGSGASFLTPPLEETTTYTAQVTRNRSAGLPLNETTASAVGNRIGGLEFDCHYPVTLFGFKVKARESGARIIRLLNSTGQVLKNRIVSIPEPGEYDIEFAVNIPIGEGYVLEQTGGRPLYYRSSGNNYPMTLGPVLTITGSTGQNMPSWAYAHFYDWQVSYVDYCGPSSIELTPTAGENVPTALFEPSNRDLILGSDDIVSFENLSSAASSYRWDFGDGETSTETSPSHQYTTPGTYFVTLVAISEEGCENTWLDTINVQVDQTVNTNELTNGTERLSLFPNPTSGEVFLELPTSTSTGGQLQLMDLNGRVLNQQIWRSPLHKLELGELPAGVYLLRYEQAGQVLIGKVIRQ